MNTTDNNHQQLATFLDYLPMTSSSSGAAKGKSSAERVDSKTGTPMKTGSSDSSRESNEDSGYNSDEEPFESTSESLGEDTGDSSTLSSGIEIEEILDINERIEFLQAKREILGRANSILQRDENELLTVVRASKQYAHTQKQMIQGLMKEGRGSPSSVSSLELDPPDPPIWNEARDILEKLNATCLTTGKIDRRRNLKASPVPDFPSNIVTKTRNCPGNPKDPAISFDGVVSRLASNTFDYPLVSCASSICEPNNGDEGDIGATQTSLLSFGGKSWMAQALIQTAQEHHRFDQKQYSAKKRPRKFLLGPIPPSSSWKILPPSLGSNFGFLIPPSGSSFATIDLQQATAPQTTEARIVTQATPPFLVVYANRAFLQMVDTKVNPQDNLQEQDPSPPILGHPIESLFEVLSMKGNDQSYFDLHRRSEDQQDGPQHGNADTKNGNSCLSSCEADDGDKKPMSSSKNAPLHTQEHKTRESALWLDSVLTWNKKSCSIQIVAVADRSPRRKMPLSASEARRASHYVMSHIMVKVRERSAETNNEIVDPVPVMIRPQPFRVVLQHSDSSSGSNGSSAEDDGEDEAPRQKKPRILGTVG